MKSDNILKADLLDIVFDNRNKDYGAYELRKNYRKRLIKSLSGAFIIAGAIACITMFVKEKKGETVFDIGETLLVTLVEPEAKKPLEPKKPEQPKPAQKAGLPKPVDQQKYVSQVVIDKDINVPDKIQTLSDDAIIGNKNVKGDPFVGQVIVDKPITITEGGDVVPVIEKVDIETPRETAEIMPAYPGGMAALRKFLQKNLQSPEDLDEGAVISVKVKFIVGYDGKLKGFEVVEDGGAPYNKEVIRVLKKMPEWIPGKAKGENVSVYYTIPVKFTAAN